MPHFLDSMARILFATAIKEDRCGELLECLFNDGTATVDAVTGKMVLISGDLLAGIANGTEGG